MDSVLPFKTKLPHACESLVGRLEGIEPSLPGPQPSVLTITP